MIAVAPLVYSGDRERAFWTEGPGRRHVEEVFGTLARHEAFETVVAISPEPEKWENLQARVVSVSDGRRPRDGAAWFARLAKHAREFCSAKDLVVCLDTRNPDVHVASIMEAVKLYERKSFPLVCAVTMEEDHPCQWKNYFNVEDVGIVHLFERDASGARLRSSPEDFGLEAAAAFDVFATAVEENVSPRSCGVFHKDLEMLEETGDTSIFERVVVDDGGVTLSFPTSPNDGVRHVMVQAFSNGDIENGQPTLQSALDGNGRVRLALDGEWDFLTYLLLESVLEGPYQLKEPIMPPTGLWSVAGDGRTCIAGSTDPILGRQDFPPVAMHECALIAATCENLPRAQRIFESGEAGAVVIDGRSLMVQAEEDAAYAEAVLQLSEKTNCADGASPSGTIEQAG